jgi:hypothetical protein
LVNPEPTGGGAFGSGGGGAGAPSGRSGGVTDPAGALGSKNPGGLGRFETSSMWRAATPASVCPGLRPMRGSSGAAGFCCACTSAALIAIATTPPSASRLLMMLASVRCSCNP